MTLFRGTQREHSKFAHHMAAERSYEELKNGRMLQRWVMKSRANHWLDAVYMACAAGHFAGWRLTGERLAERKAPTGYARAEGKQGKAGGRVETKQAPTDPTPQRRGYKRGGGGGGWQIGR